MTKIIMTGFVIVGLVITGVVLATNSQDQNKELLLRQLRSDSWEQRAEAFNKLNLSDIAEKSTEVKAAMIDLLELENLLIETTLRESGGYRGVSARYGERYSEYYSQLLSLVETVADREDPRVLSVLVRSAYNPESPFASKLTKSGEKVAPMLIALSKSDIAMTRGKAFAMLGQVIAKRQGQMSLRTMAQIREVLTQGASDSDENARKQAIQALSKISK
ncbi:MAG: hypothetical protein AB7U82_16320 [Blastocatellales bacterium]